MLWSVSRLILPTDFVQRALACSSVGLAANAVTNHQVQVRAWPSQGVRRWGDIMAQTRGVQKPFAKGRTEEAMFPLDPAQGGGVIQYNQANPYPLPPPQAHLTGR